ncbi:alpha-N-acetylgalactosaminidase-like isoform X2 [Lycorma delicatula]|uniref:alpha-N-acetylgalactosaminidase-like isoform X2 n=1 Tax=Lycorma delicatula TaxID=130591 RepID=UPI003F50F627
MDSYNSYVSIVILLILLNPVLISGLDNGVALTPPMGWMSWERYRCNVDCNEYPDECISERLFHRMADLLVSEGYAEKGYKYVIMDDCWLSHERDKNGRLQPDPDRFPNGIKALSDYIHSKNLYFGIYEDYGNFTCAGYPGILGHMKTDAQLFKEWEVDYVKLDGCYSNISQMDKGYPEFGRHLNETGRKIVYSCSWPAYQEDVDILPDYEKIAENCNLWRNYDDIQDSYDSVVSIVQHFGKMQDIYAPVAGPGHWNDPDMLIIGNFGLSYEQSKMQMAMWAILAAPLIMSNDLENIRPEYKEILLNEDVIKINQDKLGIQGRRIFENCKNKYLPVLGVSLFWNQMISSGVMRCQSGNKNIEIWTRPITPVSETYFSYAIAFVSYRTDGTPFPFSVSLSDLGLYYPNGYFIKVCDYDFRMFLINQHHHLS